MARHFKHRRNKSHAHHKTHSEILQHPTIAISTYIAYIRDYPRGRKTRCRLWVSLLTQARLKRDFLWVERKARIETNFKQLQGMQKGITLQNCHLNGLLRARFLQAPSTHCITNSNIWQTCCSNTEITLYDFITWLCRSSLKACINPMSLQSDIN